MIYFVYYKPNAFDSPRALRIAGSSETRAILKASEIIKDMASSVDIVTVLPKRLVCPECYHPWSSHQHSFCAEKIVKNIDGEIIKRSCPCKKKRPKNCEADVIEPRR